MVEWVEAVICTNKILVGQLAAGRLGGRLQEQPGHLPHQPSAPPAAQRDGGGHHLPEPAQHHGTEGHRFHRLLAPEEHRRNDREALLQEEQVAGQLPVHQQQAGEPQVSAGAGRLPHPPDHLRAGPRVGVHPEGLLEQAAEAEAVGHGAFPHQVSHSESAPFAGREEF